MKRPSLLKRRARRTGQSPYRRYLKREFLYSNDYQNWAVAFRPRKKSQTV